MNPTAIVLCIFWTFSVSNAYGSLGQNLDVLMKEKEKWKQTEKSSSYRPYTTYGSANEMLQVRQYADTLGNVFAITWKGINHPDLSELLGQYFSDYSATDAQQTGLRSQPLKRVITDFVVVEKWGHMGSVAGRAYLKNGIPKEVKIDALF